MREYDYKSKTKYTCELWRQLLLNYFTEIDETELHQPRSTETVQSFWSCWNVERRKSWNNL